MGIEGDYEAIETKPENLADMLKNLADKEYRGVNLTVPLKEEVLPLLCKTSPIATMMGAVNTVTFTEKGYVGHNSPNGDIRIILLDSAGSTV